MMNANGVFVGQLCHIEAAEEGGERFNVAMTNEQRRATSNLMLMCYEHHQETNDVDRFTVEILSEYKKDHENRFSRPDRAILESLVDWTRLEEPTEARNLKRMREVLGWKLTDEDLQGTAGIVNAFIAKFRVVPVDVRRFVGAVAMRMYRVRETSAVESGLLSGEKILASDLRGAFGLSDAAIAQRANEIEAYGLGSIAEIFQNDMEQPAVRISRIDGWPFWPELAEFCEKAPENIDAFTVDLDFGRLDG